MNTSIKAAVNAWVGKHERQAARVISSLDGCELLQYCEGSAVAQMHLTGRPDGIRVGMFDSVLQMLRARRAPGDGDSKPITPQEWMELDREFAQYQQRRKGLLIAASEAHAEGSTALAQKLYRLAAGDAGHGLVLIEFVAAAHPAGRMHSARPEGRPALLAQQAIALAVADHLAGDQRSAATRLRGALAGVDESLRLNGVATPEASSPLRDLHAFEELLRAETEVPAAAVGA